MADGRIIIDTEIDSKGAEKDVSSLGSKLGSAAKTGLKVFTGALTVASAAVTGLAKMAISGYAEYEQLVGGVETLFKTSSNEVINYANNAYKTAGLSANKYMETVTGFSASLLQGLGGDTKKAAQIGNMAVTDMADNANKMGTSMESIQNAYQGFAKQNYTMLDNLKLGYGGTKAEMQRLLVDAEKLTGVKYDINNFSDVIEAIHAIQNEIGITGTTALEAEQTISGSLNMTKAAWSNLLTGMADDNANFDTLVNNLVESVSAFASNILPRLKVALVGIGELISRLAKKIPDIIQSVLPDIVQAGVNILGSLAKSILDSLPILVPVALNIINLLAESIFANLPKVLQMGIDIIVQLALGIAQQLPTLIPLAIDCILQLVNALIGNLPMIVNAGMQILTGLTNGIVDAIPILVEMLPQIIESIINFLTESLPMILEMGLTILLALIDGLVQCIPQLIAMLPQIINTILTFITENLPMILDMGIKVLLALIDGLLNAIPQLIAMLPTIINTVVNTLIRHLPQIIQAGVQILVALIKGLIQAIPKLISAIPTIVGAIFSAFREVDWGEIGINIVKGVWEGIKGMGNWLASKVSDFFGGIVKGAKRALGIHSPSRIFRDQVGAMMAQGVGVGFEDETDNIKKDMRDSLSSLTSKMQATVDYETSLTTARVVAHNNRLSGGVEEGNGTSKENPVTVVAKFIVDGKEFTQAVVAPNQGVLADYYEGR